MIDEEFKYLVKKIHTVNKGWHCFESINRLFDISVNRYLQNYFLNQKNLLQTKLENNYAEKIQILPPDKTGFPSIEIKKEFQFESYKDACHKLKK